MMWLNRTGPQIKKKNNNVSCDREISAVMALPQFLHIVMAVRTPPILSYRTLAYIPILSHKNIKKKDIKTYNKT
jgi:hypothetical protein